MTQLTTVLRHAKFGIGNAQHEHVHRHNVLLIEDINLDRLKFEQETANAVSMKTVTDIARQSGQLSARPSGFVSIEEGFNHRCGIAMMQFEVESNAQQTSFMTVVGYLLGGTQSHEGLSGDVRFMPVRCWSTLERSTHDANGMPMVKRVIESSHQFLMGDPYGKTDLAAVRPYDIGNAALGIALAEAQGNPQGYGGSANAALNTQVLVSKTNNLDPVHHNRELLKMAVRTGEESRHDASPAYALGGCLTNESLGEISPGENPFMFTMMSVLGVHSLTGFRGWSVDELAEVWPNFTDVLNLEALNVNKFAADNTILETQAYGTAGSHEIYATEIAMSTVHLLLAVGLMSYQFSATNNPLDFNGIESDGGVAVAFSPGEAMSVLEADWHVDARVERFNSNFVDSFFARYSGPYVHQRTLMNIRVEAFMFGEIEVSISLNGDTFNTKKFSNAAYYINHTSSVISGSQNGLNESKNYLQNIKDYF